MQVIIALAKKGTKHVPHRSSKLTHFLKDSIGGNCQTRLIACVWSDVRSHIHNVLSCVIDLQTAQTHATCSENPWLCNMLGL